MCLSPMSLGAATSSRSKYFAPGMRNLPNSSFAFRGEFGMNHVTSSILVDALGSALTWDGVMRKLLMLRAWTCPVKDNFDILKMRGSMEVVECNRKASSQKLQDGGRCKRYLSLTTATQTGLRFSFA